MARIPYGVALAAISQDTSPIRFEAYCNDAISTLEGGAFVASTSVTYDRGRDGRSIGRGAKIFMCASLQDYPDEKAELDVAKLLNYGSKPDKLYFCTSQEITEDRAIKIEGALRRLLQPEVSVDVLGARQLADFASQNSDIMLRHYPAEVREILRAFDIDSGSNATENLALQLALCTIGHQDSEKIREAIYKSYIRIILDAGKKLTLTECSRDMATRLKLSRNISEDVIKFQMNKLIEEGQISIEDGRYSLTKSGIETSGLRTETVARQLLKGRNEIRQEIERLIGYTLTDDHYARIWQAMQDKLAYFFYHRGKEMVDIVSSMLDEVPGETKETNPSAFFIRDLANSAAATCATPEQTQEIRLAVENIFSEKIGSAFDWIAKTCAAYISICTMGLEHHSGEQVRRLVARIALIFDTDVLLSFLGEGEPEHSGVREIVSRWRQHGGKMLLATPVLSEAAHHAAIAQNDYHMVSKWLPGTTLERTRYIANVFVRSFAYLMAEKKAKKSHWSQYIGQFRGLGKQDSANISAYLHGEGIVDRLPRPSSEKSSLQEQVKTYLAFGSSRSDASTRESKIKEDKAARDAELYVSLVQHAERLHKTDPSFSCFLVTSSGRLSAIEKKFGSQQGQPLVLPISAILYLLSLIPGASIGLHAMQTLLFDQALDKYTSNLEFLLLRVIKESKEYSAPWIKKVTLVKDVKAKVINKAIEYADRKGKQALSERSAEFEVVKPENIESTVETLRQALDGVTDTRVGLELAAAKKRIAELEGKLARKK